MRVSARTDVGMIRRGNEDCFLVADLSTGRSGLTPEVSAHRVGEMGSLLIVSDGMGGAAAGELASDLSVNGVREEMLRAVHLTDVSRRLQHAVEVTNRVVWQHAQENPHLAGMGATLTAVLCHGPKAFVAQVGDSRAYLVRSGRIKQLTKDQSLVQLLMDAKAIKPEQANQVPNNVILQALGTRPEIVVAMTSVDLCVGDSMMLCSDGLSNKVTADEMRDAIVNSGSDLGAACKKLIELANARGGEDNITTLIARFDGTSLQSASEKNSITASLCELTANDLLRIGGAQLDFYQDPMNDFLSASADSDHVIGDHGGMHLISTQPGVLRQDMDPQITQVAMPAIQLPPPPAAPPLPAAPPPPAAPAPATPSFGAPTAPLGHPAPAPQVATAPLPHMEFPQPTAVPERSSYRTVAGVLFMLASLVLLLGAAFVAYWFFAK